MPAMTTRAAVAAMIFVVSFTFVVASLHSDYSLLRDLSSLVLLALVNCWRKLRARIKG